MSGRRLRAVLYSALAAVYVLHNDLWLWNDGRLLAGLPVGLLYHVGYCIVVAVLMAALARWAWPDTLEADGES